MPEMRTELINATILPPKEAFLATLGERVRALRARRGMTRKVLAKTAQVSERHLANLHLTKRRSYMAHRL